MQIKRFEAADMTEALRMVKREFGEDAVILSARGVRSGGFFSALRKKSVEITAATDYPVDDARDSNEFSGLLSKQLDTESENDRVSLSSQPRTIMPFTGNVRSFSHQPHLENHDVPDGIRDLAEDPGMISAKEKSAPGTNRCWGTGEPSAAAPIQCKKSNDLVAEPFYRDLATRKIIALVGTSGAGKSTSVAKLAWHCRVVEKKRVGLVSLDRFRIGANGLLERVARIMNLQFAVVHDEGQLKSALGDLSDADVVLVDTPGMGSTDPSMMIDVAALLRSANPDEIHMVANATVRDEVFTATVNTFSLLGVNRLIFTHMDEHPGGPAVLNLLKKVRIPSSFHGNGVELSDGLKETTAGALAGVSPRVEPAGGQVTAFSGNRAQIKSGLPAGGGHGGSIQYVANRNSELFHHPSCKSVKRINAENIAAFNSIEQAMEAGFKPCRACCNSSMIRKTGTGAFGYQRASVL